MCWFKLDRSIWFVGCYMTIHEHGNICVNILYLCLVSSPKVHFWRDSATKLLQEFRTCQSKLILTSWWPPWLCYLTTVTEPIPTFCMHVMFSILRFVSVPNLSTSLYVLHWVWEISWYSITKQVCPFTAVIWLCAGEQHVKLIRQLAVWVEWLLLQCILWTWQHW